MNYASYNTEPYFNGITGSNRTTMELDMPDQVFLSKNNNVKLVGIIRALTLKFLHKY